MIKGSCHCGAVHFEVRKPLEWITECNCSACRKLGTIWAHADESEIDLTHAEGATLSYVWGDKTLAFHSCKTCGCTTHWLTLDKADGTRMAVNMRLAEPADVANIPVRHFDGADTWRYLD
ncbi:MULTISPECIES: GFA family protein [Kordiimonas]|jgi:hypothetical protein|uniref:GFA family protein n=1 Tax=Kordiimonas TaxID=288021 RepID=UPI00257A665F|nr:GFA family protein [Kordiimonas sp. UBA4487]